MLLLILIEKERRKERPEVREHSATDGYEGIEIRVGNCATVMTNAAVCVVNGRGIRNKEYIVLL